ncbi:hypothetical protein COW94_05095 [Candidatus Peregrinibacteria bacterium CG22_combo_CG10-13_8_21_14_all_44_10]|nr:MAG: hypothetical protein COW94_05095 [Candidatus Peregrinibacteria bacterium CG22_combo_CG10-13_8_21_14_all_44_10]PIX79330.1 MAG: hypothetical protein COZ35_03625 [Candidatus Peregrinibacteria bacterium CG_4_10_14_3_um_filter_44_21]PJB88416.1 MAG: hypothetical protein CO082_04650 [Candidatus Peregrinibacteria bacterium CG_4_9_14_0_8_um_filter_44_15]
MEQIHPVYQAKTKNMQIIAHRRKTKNYIKTSKKALTDADHEFLKKLVETQKKSECLRAHVASIVVNADGEIIAKATNSPHKIYSCKKIGCIRDIRKVPSGSRREICYGICAEQYCFVEMAKKGVSCKGGTIYVTSHPCRICESMIAESGIKRVVFIKGYPDMIPEYDILPDYKIEVVQAKEYGDTKPHTI